MCIKFDKKPLTEMVSRANHMLGTNISYTTFVGVKSAFTSGYELMFGEIQEAFKKYPKISKAEVLRLFKRETLAHPETLISGQSIFRTHLITIVEALEKWTGLEMCNDNNHYGPLADYDDKGITVEDIAIYFATGEGRVAEIKKTIETKAENS